MENNKRKPARSFKDLIVWQKAHLFVVYVYSSIGSFPKNEMFGLEMQLKKAAVSIAANIVEGFRRKSSAEKKRFLNIAQGSADECSYYLILSKDLKFISEPKLHELETLLDEVSCLLNAFNKAIE